MNMRTLALIFMLASSSLVQSDMVSPVGDAVNSVIGKTYHWMTAAQGDTRLKPEHEKFAQEIAEKMGITQKIEFHKIPDSSNHLGPHCAGNHIYLNEKDFEDYAEQPDALRMVIGHELVHADKYHGLKLVGAMGVIAYGLYKVVNRFSQQREKLESSVSFLNPSLVHSFTNVLIGQAIGFLAVKAVAPLGRLHERQADSEALERLTPFYGKENLRRGFVRYASKFSHLPGSLVEKLFATHPHFYERYANLGVDKTHAEGSVELFKKQMKTYVRSVVLDRAANSALDSKCNHFYAERAAEREKRGEEYKLLRAEIDSISSCQDLSDESKTEKVRLLKEKMDALFDGIMSSSGTEYEQWEEEWKRSLEIFSVIVNNTEAQRAFLRYHATLCSFDQETSQSLLKEIIQDLVPSSLTEALTYIQAPEDPTDKETHESTKKMKALFDTAFKEKQLLQEKEWTAIENEARSSIEDELKELSVRLMRKP